MPSIVVRSTRDSNGNTFFIARANGGTFVRIPRDSGLSDADNERDAVFACIKKCDWHTEGWAWHRSGLPTSTGYEAVWVSPNESFTTGVASMVRVKGVY